MSTAMIDDLRRYFSTQPVLKAWLFGSFSRGEETPASDVDLLVQYDRSKPIGLFKIGRMTNELCKITGRDVDLVDEGSVFPWALDSINHDKLIIYERAN